MTDNELCAHYSNANALEQGQRYTVPYEGIKLMFTAPIDIPPSSLLAVRISDGQLMWIGRKGMGVVWRYEPEPNTFTMTGTITNFNEDLWRKLVGVA